MDGCTGNPPGPAPTLKDPTSAFGRCPTHWLIRQLADRWSLPVLSALHTSPKRFTELLQLLHPVSRRMLDRTLKKLMQIGLVTRTIRPPAGQQVRYDLTELGRTLAPPIGRLVGWSQRNIHAVEAVRGGRSRRPAPGGG